MRGTSFTKGGIKNYERKETIKITAVNTSALLADFLNEILARSNINKAIYKVSSIKHIADKGEENIEAEILRFKVDKFDEDVKAVTYHEADIRKENLV